jgi:hypothetical protein
MTAPEIQHEIEQTRKRLGQTVEELAAKADLKARARAKAAEMKARAQGKVTQVSRHVTHSQAVQRRWPLAAAAGILVLGSAALIWRLRKA